MNSNKIPEEGENKPKITFRNIFYHNTVVLAFSFVCAVVIWFTMAYNNALGPSKVYDVPVIIQLSDAAQEEGIHIFSQSYDKATVSITGSSIAVDRITAKDLSVVGKLSPLVNKLSGNTMLTETISLVASKGDTYSDYEVVAIEPDTVTVVYDRYKEASFQIENNMKYATTADYFIPTPTISEKEVVVSGPESSVSKVSRVSLDYEISEQVTQSQSFVAKLTAYDKNNKALALSDLHLSLSVESVEVDLEVQHRETAELKITTLNVPEGFSESRITIEPETIDIAGDLETVSKYKTITLPDAVDFSKVNTKNNSYEMEIPMPTGVKNVSNVDKAKVTVNLNSFQETSITTKNLKLVNVPEEKDVDLVTKSLLVDVVGSTAQVNRLTAASVYGTIDMAKMTEKNGNIEVPVTVSISNATSCWVYGQYTVHVNVKDKAVQAQAAMQSSQEP